MKRSLVVLMLSALLTLTLAASWSGSFRFPASLIDAQPVRGEGMDFTRLVAQPDVVLKRQNVGVRYEAAPGAPQLPYWTFTLVIPQGQRVAGVDVTAGDEQLLGTFTVYPAQAPVPVSRRSVGFTAPDAAVYSSSTPRPGRFTECSPVGVKSGFRLATVNLYPLQHVPATGRLTLAASLSVTVRFEPDPAAGPEALTARQYRLFSGPVRALVANPEDVSRFAPPLHALDFGEYDFVIVTSDGLQSYFQPLVDWRTRIGYTTVIRTVSWITANYSGRDTPERIRNFVRDYYTNHGTMWVLLGGDYTVVPDRQARSYVSSETGNIPTDLYYVDLQWSWDGDNDNVFGEISGDTVDFYYDLYVGRASVETQAEVQTFCSKVITHESNPPTDYLRRILLVDAALWTGYNDEQSNDSIAAITPAGWSDVRFHDPVGTTAVRDSLNNGFQFCHMVGHGNDVGIYNGGTAYYGNAVIGGHNNGDRVGLINSIACYPGNFEYSDCLAENSHNCSTGGSLALLFNSRYGWGPGPGPNPPGPSELLDVRFYDYFFNHDTLPIGLTHAESKEAYRSLCLTTEVWRWCCYELNMLGDPLLMMYEAVPTALSAAFPSPISTGSQSFAVTVTAGGSPVNRAIVCVHKGSEVYDRGYTNASGQVTFTVNPTSAGYMRVTATAANHLPDLDSAQVIVTALDAGCYRIAAPSGVVDSGTVVSPSARVRNYSVVGLTNVAVRFAIGTVYADTEVIASLGAGDSALVTFANWSARPGSYATVCSTMLTGDAVPSNDRSTGTLTVHYHDVGAVSVTVPSPVDSGASVSIVARVHNYGNVTETFDSRVTISGTTYSQTRAKTLSAGAEDTVIFPSWTAVGRGSHTVACTTLLSGDMRSANNRTTSTVVVQVHDVGATVVMSPTGTFDSTGTAAAQARVRNRGSVTESFQVSFSISGPASWSDTAMVNNLAAGDSVVVNFGNWTVGPRGSYTTACSTMLATDQVSANNRATGSFAVRVRDCAAVVILQPPATIDSGTTVPVQVVIENRGSAAASAKTVVTVAGAYYDSMTVLLSAAQRDTLLLDNWTARVARGSYPVVCSTWTLGDQYPANNVVRGAVTVNVHDVAATGILAPSGQYDSGATAVPQARVRNNGSQAESFAVRFLISDGYLSTQSITLGAGRDTTLAFATWTAQFVGSFSTRCSTSLTTDQNPANNRVSGAVQVAGSDVGISAITAPAAQVDPGPVNPACKVINNSPLAKSFRTFCRVGSPGGPVFVDSVDVVGLLPDSTVEVVFGVWNATAGGYTVRCSLGVADRNPANDTLSASCLVLTHDVALSAILAPTGVMRPVTVSPLARITNNGTGTEDCPVLLTVTDTVTGSVVYADSTVASGLTPAETRDVRFTAWLPPLGYFRLTACARLPVDIDRTNDSASARLKVTPGEIGWQQRPDVPGSAPVKYGGSLATLEGRVYALKGNKTFELHSFEPATNAWQTLAPVPGGPSGKPVNKSGDICSDGSRYLYAVKGNRTCEFWRYDVDGNSWTPLTDVPLGSRALRNGTGLACVVTGDSTLVFCLKASGTWEFYVFHAESGQWLTRAAAPMGQSGKAFKNGSALCADDNRLLALKSGENEFYGYDIAADRWYGLEPLPGYSSSGRRSRAKDGADLGANSDGITYAFCGGGRSFFFKYENATGHWTELTAMPLGPSGRKIKAGGSLVAVGKQVYAFKGSSTFEFWIYTPDTMLLMLPSRPQRDGISAADRSADVLWFGPNPAGRELSLRWTASDRSPAKVELVSSLGRVVLERTVLSGTSATLSLVHLPAGTYFLRVSTRAQVRTAKVAINR